MANNPIFKRFDKAEALTYVDALCAYVNEYTQAANVFSEVAQKFDGKVYNKRFTNAVQAALDETCGTTLHEDAGRTYKLSNVTISVDDYSTQAARFKLNVKNRSVKIRSSWIYFENEFMNDIPCGYATHFIDNNRINAKRFAESADAAICENLHRLRRYIDAVRNWDVYVAKLKEIDAYLLAQTAEMNPLFVRSECRTLVDNESVYLHAFDTYHAKQSK